MLALQITESQIVNLISQLDLDSLEKVRKAIIRQELYFKKFQKAPIEKVLSGFKAEGYSEGVLADLENGLKKSRIYTK